MGLRPCFLRAILPELMDAHHNVYQLKQRDTTMTSTVITDTITSVVVAELGADVASQYAPAIEKISEALTEQAYQASDRLIETAAEELDYSEDTARDFIERVIGLPVRPKPEPVVEEPTDEDFPSVDMSGQSVESLSDTDRIRLLEEGQATLNRGMTALLDLANKVKSHLGIDD